MLQCSPAMSHSEDNVELASSRLANRVASILTSELGDTVSGSTWVAGKSYTAMIALQEHLSLG